MVRREGYFPQDWSSLPAGTPSGAAPGGAAELELAWLERSTEPRPRVEAALLWAAVESGDSTLDLQLSHPSGWTSGRPFVFLSPSASETLCRWRPQFSVTHPPLPCVLSGEGLLLRSRACAGLLFAFFYSLLSSRSRPTREGYFPQDWSSLPAGTPSGGRVGLRLELAWLDRAETPR